MSTRPAPLGPIKAGDEVYLNPRTPTAGRDVWQEPRVLVESIDATSTTVRRLDNGQSVTTHPDNLTRRQPQHAPRKPRTVHRRPLDGAEEVPLW